MPSAQVRWPLTLPRASQRLPHASEPHLASAPCNDISYISWPSSSLVPRTKLGGRGEIERDKRVKRGKNRKEMGVAAHDPSPHSPFSILRTPYSILRPPFSIYHSPAKRPLSGPTSSFAISGSSRFVHILHQLASRFRSCVPLDFPFYFLPAPLYFPVLLHTLLLLVLLLLLALLQLLVLLQPWVALAASSERPAGCLQEKKADEQRAKTVAQRQKREPGKGIAIRRWVVEKGQEKRAPVLSSSRSLPPSPTSNRPAGEPS